MFPAATEECLDFLEKTLQFNPMKRITIDDALDHPFVGKVKDKSKEIVANEICTIEFEKEGDLPVTRLRELFIQEILFYKNSNK